jgi:N-acylneuraminate cytidylyltransferase
VLKEYLLNNQIDPQHVIFVGNDINDVACFPVAACAVAVADAHFSALSQADLILTRKGGEGAVRELCDLLLQG